MQLKITGKKYKGIYPIFLSHSSAFEEEEAGSPTNTLTSIETSASSPIILFSLKRQYLVKFIGWCHNIPSI